MPLDTILRCPKDIIATIIVCVFARINNDPNTEIARVREVKAKAIRESLGSAGIEEEVQVW